MCAFLINLTFLLLIHKFFNMQVLLTCSMEEMKESTVSSNIKCSQMFMFSFSAIKVIIIERCSKQRIGLLHSRDILRGPEFDPRQTTE